MLRSIVVHVSFGQDALVADAKAAQALAGRKLKRAFAVRSALR